VTAAKKDEISPAHQEYIEILNDPKQDELVSEYLVEKREPKVENYGPNENERASIQFPRESA
jgi:hypothetical protein